MALKTSVMVDMTPESMSCFIRESEMLRKLNHPNIVRLIGVAFSPPDVMIVLPLHGPSLQSILSSWRLGGAGSEHKLSVAHLWCTQLARGLEYLHSLGVAHCDVKPPNILVDSPLKSGASRLSLI